ncbi:hypothetical protein ASF30_07085 [Leifsonia sp. Leaf264]|nr:hypothetical protein ASF30_07085 [Leifsonia sp. Leaf264]
MMRASYTRCPDHATLGQMNAHHIVHEAGGLAPSSALREAGLTPAAIQKAVLRGDIYRVRKGWFTCPEVDVERRVAARVGGRLTGTTAAAALGIWTPPDQRFHVALPHNACRPRARSTAFQRSTEVVDPGLVLHWNDDRSGQHPFIVPATIWIPQVIDDVEAPRAAAVIDSALRLGRIGQDEWRSVLGSLPLEKRQGFDVVDGAPETGTESMVRFALNAAGIIARPQFEVGRRRGDLLVGDRLILEIDSEVHHARIRDSKRDRELAASGYVVLHFDYVEVMYDLPAVIAEIVALVRAGVHLRAAV